MTNSLVPTPGLPPAIVAAIVLDTASTFGSDGQFDGSIVSSAKLTGEHSEEAIRSALARVSEACRPGGAAVAMQALAELRALTKSRALDGDEATVTATAYADRMAIYPADVIRSACRSWSENSTWWPAWAELKKECDRLVSRRLAERAALQEALKPKMQPLYLGKPIPETREQRLRTSINGWLRNNRQDRAAPLERALAAAEKREPQEWAKPQPAQPSNLAERPPFVPSTSPTSKRMAELAEEFRAKQAAERAAIYTTQAAE